MSDGRQIIGNFPRQIEMMPIGGISLTTAREFLGVGVFALGICADLVDTKAVPEGRNVHVIQKSAEYLLSFSHSTKATDHRLFRSEGILNGFPDGLVNVLSHAR